MYMYLLLKVTQRIIYYTSCICQYTFNYSIKSLNIFSSLFEGGFLEVINESEMELEQQQIRKTTPCQMCKTRKIEPMYLEVLKIIRNLHILL